MFITCILSVCITQYYLQNYWGIVLFFLLWFSMLVYLSQNMYKCENVLLNNHFQSLCAD